MPWYLLNRISIHTKVLAFSAGVTREETYFFLNVPKNIFLNGLQALLTTLKKATTVVTPIIKNYSYIFHQTTMLTNFSVVFIYI